MSLTSAGTAVATLIAAFPSATIPEATFALYTRSLSDIPDELLGATVIRVIEASRFFPTISELRQTAARLAGLLPPTEAEALAIVRQADVRRPVYRRDGSLAYTEREWAWPEDLPEATLDLVRETLARVGEPCDAGGESHFGWETGFSKTYALAAEAVSRTVLGDLSGARLLPAPSAPLLGSGAR